MTSISHRKASRGGFSMIELIIVVAITGIIAAIAVPKFADASSGRRLQAAKKALIADVEAAKLRARATSTQHTIKIYPDDERYVIVEGRDVKRSAIVLARDLTEQPLGVKIHRTSLGGDGLAVITPFGDLTPATTIQLIDNGNVLLVHLDGIATTINDEDVPVVNVTDTELDALEIVGGVLNILGVGK